MKEKDIQIVCFSGRHANSKGLLFAKSLGVNISDRSIEGIIFGDQKPQIIIDATSALDHPKNYQIAKEHSIKIIDMTPAKLELAAAQL